MSNEEKCLSKTSINWEMEKQEKLTSISYK